MLHFKSVFTIITINLFLLIACIFSGCKKNGFGPPNYTFPKDGLAYIQLTAGKYFIYKDSATLKLDSVVVTESLLDTVSGTANSFTGSFPYTGQDYTLILSKIDSSGKSSVWLSGSAQSLTGLYMTPTDNSGGYLFRDPPDSTITTMVVEGKTYTDVILTYSTDQIIYSYYWAKGVGLIKSSKVDSLGIRKTYTLLRNN